MLHQEIATCQHVQAMDLISIAQQSGDISAELYRQKSAKPIETPKLAGLEKHHEKLMAQAQQEQNPFLNGANTSANSSPGGELMTGPHMHVPAANFQMQSILSIMS